MKISVGVDLHKTQFTVCVLSEDRRVNESGLFPTSKYGYEAFRRKMIGLMEKGYEVTAAVESTGNTRYFCNQLLQAGIDVKIVKWSFVGLWDREQTRTAAKQKRKAANPLRSRRP